MPEPALAATLAPTPTTATTPTTAAAPTRARGTTPALLTLALGYFALGTASLAVVGLGTPIGRDLHVAPAHVGLLVMVFALTFAIAAPIAPTLLGRWNPKTGLIIGLILLTLGVALSAAAPNYAALAVCRVIGALGAGIVGPGSSAAGALLVPPERRQRGLALVFGGMTAASVLGVPLVSFLGNGLGWRPALLGVAALAALALVLVVLVVPRLPAHEPPHARNYPTVLRTPGARPMLATTLLFIAALFTVYGIAGTFLASRFGAGPGLVSASLLAFGVLGVAGNALAPRIAERFGGGRTITVAVIGLAVMLAAMLVMPHGTVGIAAFVLWAFFSQLYMAPQQGRLITLLPAQPALILALNASALYLGMSIGSTLGSSLLPVLGAAPIPAIALVPLALAALSQYASTRTPRP